MVITDEYIIEYYQNHKFFKNHIKPHIQNYLISRYSDISDPFESYIRIINQIDKTPLCPICNKPAKFSIKSGYAATCGDKSCIYEYRKLSVFNKYGVSSVSQLDSTKNKVKQTTIQHYGVSHVFQSDEIKEKIKNTCLLRYGVTNPAKSSIIKNKIKNTNLLKYKTISPLQNPIIKEKAINSLFARFQVRNASYSLEIQKYKQLTCLKRYGAFFHTQNPLIIDKIRNAKSINNTHSCSKEEDYAYQLIYKIYPNAIRHYKSELYPFNCDIYIEDLDLYIECNFHWTHGKHAFDSNNQNDLEILAIWKNKSQKSPYYKSAIDTWTQRDVKKRTLAIQNHLNYIEFFTISELKNWIKHQKPY